MADSEKGASESAKAKEKKKDSLLGDMDFGKDFFTSWGPTTAAGDDGMDFDLGTVAKGKKKAFNFDELDVVFSLDGDLGKMSSFKVDISDLDISSPLKKSGTKERSKEASGNGNQQSKKDSLFSFDFNAFDTLDFEPSSKKEASKVSQNRDNVDVSNRKEGQGSKTEQRNGAGPSDSSDPNISASRGIAISNDMTKASDLEKTDLTDHSLLPPETRADDIGNSKAPTNQKLVELDEEATLPKTTSSNNAYETVQDTIRQQKTTFRSSYSPARSHGCSIKSVSEDQTTQVDYTELPAEVTSRVTKDDDGKQNTNTDSAAAPAIESPLLERQGTSGSKSGSDDTNICADNDTISVGNKDVSQPAQADVNSADTSSTNTSRKSVRVKESSTEHQHGKSEGRVSSPNSGTSKSNEIIEKEIGIVRSKFFERPGGRESQRRQNQSSLAALTMFPAKLMGSKQQADGKKVVSESKDPQNENKVSSESASLSGELSKGESGETDSARSVRVLKDIGSLLNGRKSVCSKLDEKEVVREEPIQRPDNNAKSLATLSLSTSSKSPCSTEKLPKLTTPVHATPRAVLNTVSIKSSVNISGEGNKVSTIKANRSLPDLSSLRISRTSGTSQNQTNSSINRKQIGELVASAPSKISPTISTGKPPQSSPSLKRKIYEVSNVDTLTTKSLKRLSQSPVESRNVRNVKGLLMDVNKEASNVDMLKTKPLKRFSQSPAERRNVEEVLMDANKEGGTNLVMAENHNIDYLQSPTLNIAQKANLTDFKMSLAIERDDNVEKAEAYTKDLDDISHALKKRLEEAKELLVRAVVNNNKLLLLNHPNYEETIFKVQKLSLQQTSEVGSHLTNLNSIY